MINYNNMFKPSEMTSSSVVLEVLRQKKMDNEFKWTDKGFTVGKGKYYQPQDLKVIKTYRFEGDSDPADMSVIYLIEANDGLIGFTIDAYGTYSSHDTDEGYDNFIRQIPVEERDEQLIFEV